MSFSSHTFEINSAEKNLSFAFHETIGEGQEIYFLAKFDENFVDPKIFAETIFGEIVDGLKNSQSGDAYDRFEDALKLANLEAKKKIKNKIPEILAAFFDFNNLFLSVSRGAEAYLVRGSNVSQITEAASGENELFLNILNGQVAVDDTVILASSQILRTITSGQLTDIFSQNFSAAVDALRHELLVATNENILITTIGIGKKNSQNAAGFLSKVVSKISTPQKNLKKVEKNFSPEKNLEKNPENFVEEEKNFSATKKNFLEKIKNLRPQKNLVLVAGAILGVLAVVILGKSIDFESENTKILREELSIATEALEQTKALLLQGERGGAKEHIARAEEAVQKILNSKSKNFRSNAQFLLAEIEEKKLQIENAHKKSAMIVADLGVKNNNLESLGILNLRDNLFIFDSKNIYKTIRNIVENPLQISEKNSILAGAVRDDQNTLLFLTNLPQIVEFRDGGISQMSTDDENWKNGTDIKTYGKYVYILNPVENQIWKYERRRTKYSGAIAYNTGADLSSAVSIAIDGSIYILSSDGKIQRIFRGENKPYNFKNLPSIPFSGKNLKIFTSKDHDFLYVLDPDNSRVLIFEKGDQFAIYKKQIIFKDVKTSARDFFVDSSGQKIAILTKDKIYEFSL